MIRRSTLPTLILMLTALLPLGAQSPVVLRQPSGKYQVARRTLFLADSARGEPATPDPGDRRSLTLHIWYPGMDQTPATAPYMPLGAAYRAAFPPEILKAWDAIRSPVRLDARPASGAFPVLVFSHGWSARSASYSIWLSEVASHGFVVIGIDHPYLGAVATARGDVTEPTEDQFGAVRHSADLFYAQDVAFTLSALARLNVEDPVLRGAIKPGVVFAAGHSSGFGSVMSAYAELHPGLAGVISFDSGRSGLAGERDIDAPLLLIRAEDPSYTDIFVRGPKVNPRGTIYDSAFVRRHAAPFYDMLLLGTGHSAVMDNVTGYLSPDRVEVESTHDLIARYTVAFLTSALHRRFDLAVQPRDSAKVRLRRVRLGGR